MSYRPMTAVAGDFYEVSWSASKAMASCLESARIPTIPFVA